MKTAELLQQIAADWTVARPDIDPAPMLTVIALQRLSARLEGELEAMFALHDLTPAAFDVLATLRRSAPPGGLAFSRLSALMAITPPAVTKRVDALEARGMVGRTLHPADRRATLVQLTPTGRALVDKVLPHHVANEERLLAALSGAERHTLRALVAKLTAGIERPDEPPAR